MLSEEKLQIIHNLTTQLSREEQIWLSGYIAGKAQIATSVAPATITEAIAIQANVKLTLLYGTETGNSKQLATSFASELKQKGVRVKLSGLDQYRMTDIAKEENLLLVISTQGDGEMPAMAQKFYDYLKSGATKLSKLKYAVLGLGDSSYPQFCQAAIDFDALFLHLEATQLSSVQLCDTDYKNVAKQWLQNTIAFLSGSSVSPKIITPSAGKKNYKGEVITHINLNDIGSNKATYHIEISASDVVYEAGDALGLLPHNAEEEVKRILNRTGVDGTQIIDYKGEQLSIATLLSERLNITALSDKAINEYAQIAKKEIKLSKPSLADLIAQYPMQLINDYASVIPKLDRNAPRLYSIASSPLAHEGEVHLTVAQNTYTKNGELKQGLTSSYLSKLGIGSKFSFYIHKNEHFRLPSGDKDIIMIGPGTGIAPFRSFLAQRDAEGANGKNWLFFGEQHFTTDFLYQTELQSWYASGVLTHLDVAFSRDQQQKIYVQHRILEKRKTFFEWLQKGAYVYVCGAKTPMSEDVEQAILQVIEKQGNITSTQAKDYLAQLSDSQRYLKDVY